MSDDQLKSLINLYSNINKSDKIISKSSKSDNLDSLVKALIESRNKPEKNNLSKEEKIELLEKRYSAFIDKNTFNPGELVRWKPGLRNKGGLKYDDVAIVVDTLNEPIFDKDKDSGSPYFKEPLDMLIAFLDSDNDFIVLHVDSRRMQPAKNSSNN